MNTNDLRIQHTEETIRAVFLELLSEKPIQKIFVTEICSRAGINRTTFYKHYLDVYDLMEQTENFMIQTLIEHIDSMQEKGVEEAVVGILRLMKKHADSFLPLFDKNGDRGLVMRLGAVCFPIFQKSVSFPQHSSYGNASLEKLCYSYITAGCSGILGYWMQEHFAQTPEEVAAVILHMVNVTIQGFTCFR